jgi:hypothetical protein
MLRFTDFAYEWNTKLFNHAKLYSVDRKCFDVVRLLILSVLWGTAFVITLHSETPGTYDTKFATTLHASTGTLTGLDECSMS